MIRAGFLFLEAELPNQGRRGFLIPQYIAKTQDTCAFLVVRQKLEYSYKGKEIEHG